MDLDGYEYENIRLEVGLVVLRGRWFSAVGKLPVFPRMKSWRHEGIKEEISMLVASIGFAITVLVRRKVSNELSLDLRATIV